jgi:hypothetical protein
MKRPDAKNRLDFTPVGDFCLSDKFIAQLKHSKSPFLIMIVGNYRAGKSTRANQLILHETQAPEPFEASDDAGPLTMRFPYAGPLKIQHRARLSQVSVPVSPDPDVFLIDCEGLHCLDQTPMALRRATFALSQMVSMTVLVANNLSDPGSIERLQSSFILSRAFTRDLPGFTTGTTIMIREIGIRCRPGEKLSFDEKNARRKRPGFDQRLRILHNLSQEGIVVNERDLLVLAQPGMEEKDLYQKSIEDFWAFAASIASTRERVTGDFLLRLFDESKSSIFQVKDLRTPLITSGDIIKKAVTSYLTATRSDVVNGFDTVINERLSRFDSSELRKGLSTEFVKEMSGICFTAFQVKAQKQFPRVLECFPHENLKQQAEIGDWVSKQCNELFVQRCLTSLLPQVQMEIYEDMKREIDTTMNDSLAHCRWSNCRLLASDHQNVAATRFRAVARRIHVDIVSAPGFGKLVEGLRTKVMAYAQELENRSRNSVLVLESPKFDLDDRQRDLWNPPVIFGTGLSFVESACHSLGLKPIRRTNTILFTLCIMGMRFWSLRQGERNRWSFSPINQVHSVKL